MRSRYCGPTYIRVEIHLHIYILQRLGVQWLTECEEYRDQLVGAKETDPRI